MRAPRNFRNTLTYDDKVDAFAYEAMGEAAASLGALGKKIESGIAALEEMPKSAQGRDKLVETIRTDVYAFLVQRELVGFKDEAYVLKHYRIPGEVIASLGAKTGNNAD